MIRNSVIEDSRLSFKALGILTYLLSKPSNWVIHEYEVARSHGCGRDAVRSALRELEAAGYLIRERGRVNGRFTYDKTVNGEPLHWHPVTPPDDAASLGDDIFGPSAVE